MADAIEFDPVDTIAAGAVGIPGHRRFMIQATKNGAVLAVLLEKEQIALFATEAGTFLDNLDLTESGLDPVNDALCGQVVDVEPLFRARVIGIGYDPNRELVLIELRETPPPEDPEAPADVSEPEGIVARLYATPRAGARGDAPRRGVGRARPPALPALSRSDGSRGPSLPPVELMALLSTQAGLEVPDPVPDDVARDVLTTGTVDVLGRMPWSSNATFLASVARDGDAVLAIYKPQAGERPLWDFPDGTLCHREVAACVLSDLLGWSLVPHTVLRDDAPLGAGALQRFVDHDPEQHYFELQPGRDDVFRRFAAFDLLANNTDRKGGHVVLGTDGNVWGIDHGVCFHRQWKLRTVIWEYAGDPIPKPLLEAIGCARGRLDEFGGLLSESEIEAVGVRADRVLKSKRYPTQSGDYRDYPWPML